MKMQLINSGSICSATMKTVLLYFSSLLLVTYIQAAEEQQQDIEQSASPEVYLPDQCDIYHLNGFSQATIISQRGDRYPANYHCKVLINLHGGYNVQFTFEKMDLADPNSDGVCLDNIQFFSVFGKTNIPITDKVCGAKRPFSVLTTNSSSAMLVFNTDAYQEKTGFRIRYDRVPNNKPSSSGNTGAATGCMPGQLCSTNSGTSLRLGLSQQQTTLTTLVLTFVSFFLYWWSSR